MMFKKLSSLLCVLLITASLAVTCFAQPTAESGTNNGVGTSQNALSGARTSSDKQTYTLKVAGNDDITDKERTYMTFVVTDLEGKDLELQLRISKNVDGTIIKIANKTGNRVYSEQHPYIATSRIKLSADEAEIKVVIDNNVFIINNITSIKDVTSISDVKVVLGNDSKPESTAAPTTTASSSTVSVDDKPDTSEQADKNDDKDNDDGEKSSPFKTAIIIAIIAVVMVAALSAGGFIIKKRKPDTETRFEQKPVIESKPKNNTKNEKKASKNDVVSINNTKHKKKAKSEKKASKNDVVNINKAETPVQKADDLSRIPVGIPEPIRHTVSFEYEKTSGSTEEVVTNEPTNSQAKTDNQSVINVLLGNVDSSSLPEIGIPLLLMNSYDLNISDLMSPYFKVSSDKENAKYVVIDDKKLYINPLKYNGNNFKAYSDLTCLDKCFTIMCDYNEVKPQGQKIINIEPAFLEKSGNDYILVKKGLLNVE